MNIDNAIDYGTGASAGVLAYLAAVLGTPEAVSVAVALLTLAGNVSVRLAIRWLGVRRPWLRRWGLDLADTGQGVRVDDVDRLADAVARQLGVDELLVAEAIRTIVHDGDQLDLGDIYEAVGLLLAVRKPGELRDLVANYFGVHPDELPYNLPAKVH